MTKWTKEYHEMAMAEGWVLSERDDGYYEIQTFDDDQEDRFADDDTAYAWVAAKALECNSPLHQTALHLDKTKWSSSR